jgi:hypothetical protein
MISKSFIFYKRNLIINSQPQIEHLPCASGHGIDLIQLNNVGMISMSGLHKW